MKKFPNFLLPRHHMIPDIVFPDHIDVGDSRERTSPIYYFPYVTTPNAFLLLHSAGRGGRRSAPVGGSANRPCLRARLHPPICCNDIKGTSSLRQQLDFKSHRKNSTAALTYWKVDTVAPSPHDTRINGIWTTLRPFYI